MVSLEMSDYLGNGAMRRPRAPRARAPRRVAAPQMHTLGGAPRRAAPRRRAVAPRRVAAPRRAVAPQMHTLGGAPRRAVAPRQAVARLVAPKVAELKQMAKAQGVAVSHRMPQANGVVKYKPLNKSELLRAVFGR